MAKIGKQTFLGWNNEKTRPQLLRAMPSGEILGHYHAETHVLYKIPKHKRSQAKIYVCRLLRSGRFGMSKPCSHCLQTLLTEGILLKNIWYTNEEGAWECIQKLY